MTFSALSPARRFLGDGEGDNGGRRFGDRRDTGFGDNGRDGERRNGDNARFATGDGTHGGSDS
ncbi:MAG: hypothetical protein QOF04_2110 [Solirubrobacteraceae bacterium]|jgi:hypothetical protein|nr:hypothetical protein [Solirubrobacteraceae bacterium]